MANVLFKVGSQADFKALATKDSNTLYFLNDTLQIFRGDKEYTKSVQLVTALPSAGVQGVLYVDTAKFTLHAWNGTAWTQLSKGYATTITDAATDTDIPTSKAVKDYVTAKIAGVTGGDGIFVTEIAYANGSLTVNKGKEKSTVAMNGMVHTPTYDSETRTIKLPVFGGDELVINLGKDAVVKSGSYNAKTNELELVLTSGDPVKIPVGALIDVYTGIATPTVTVNVSEDNKISANVKLSAKANNQIIIESDGIYVPLPDAYTKAETDKKVKDVQDALDTHKGDKVAHITADERTAWNAKATTANVATAKSEAITAASADATTKANQALADAKKYADGLNTAMDTRMKAVEASVTWGTLA